MFAVVLPVINCESARQEVPQRADRADRSEGTSWIDSRGERPALVGRESVPFVYLAENHSDAFVRWAAHGVSDRLLVHFDGHIDMDRLPPETIEAIRRARSEAELRSLEVHPYDLTARSNHGFGIWNFIYAAARTGRVRREVWVVPDGSLSDRDAFQRFKTALGRTLSGISLEEYRGLSLSDGCVMGSLAGVPVTILERKDLPCFTEPVLLDVDLDYFTTCSIIDQSVRLAPRPSLDSLLETLARRGVTTDIATISYSTCGGYLPYEDRFLGPSLLLALRDPAGYRSSNQAALQQRRAAALEALEAGRAAGAERMLRALGSGVRNDGPLDAALAAALRSSGREAEAREKETAARATDPVAERLDLFRADVARMCDRMDEALALFRKFAAEHARDEAHPYALRRIAFCLLELHRPEEASEAFRKVLSARPDHADSHYNQAEALIAMGDLRGAIAEQQRACQLRPFDPHYAWRLGTLLLAAKDPRAAEPHLARAVEGKPSFAEARYNFAACLGAQGKIDQAISQAELATELDPDRAQFKALADRLMSLRGSMPTPNGTGPRSASPR